MEYFLWDNLNITFVFMKSQFKAIFLFSLFIVNVELENYAEISLSN